jgi:aminoglycoside phosphotransferase (APT) family kinase protein
MTSEIPGVPLEPLHAWLIKDGLLPADAPTPTLTRLAGGSSNLTVRLQSGDPDAGGIDWVLRRPPVRGALPTAHDMLREYRLQAALASAKDQSDVPLATMIAPCADPDVIGAPFYLMERLTGFAHTPSTLAELSRGDVHQVGLALADALAQLHAIDPAKVAAFDEFIRPEPYAGRQLRRWAGQWQRAQAATGLADEPALDRVFAKLAETRPPVPPPRVVHGDYGLANVLFDPDRPTEVQAILDWELTALGDPLADLGALCAYWSDAGRILNIGRDVPVCHPALQPDLPSVAQLVERYAERTGLGEAGVAHLDWYLTLAVARLGVIVAGALNRMDPDTQEGAAGRVRTASRVHDLAEAAEAALGRRPGASGGT